MTIKRIVVGIDGSDNGRRAMAWAADVAGPLDADVIAVHAVGLLPHPADSHGAGYVDAVEARRLVEGEWTAHVAASDLRIRWHVLDGDPVSVLLRVVGDESADLAVVGTRGRSGRPGLLLGSTSHQLAERCPCPVVIVPPNEPTAEASTGAAAAASTGADTGTTKTGSPA